MREGEQHPDFQLAALHDLPFGGCQPAVAVAVEPDGRAAVGLRLPDDRQGRFAAGTDRHDAVEGAGAGEIAFQRHGRRRPKHQRPIVQHRSPLIFGAIHEPERRRRLWRRRRIAGNEGHARDQSGRPDGRHAHGSRGASPAGRLNPQEWSSDSMISARGLARKSSAPTSSFTRRGTGFAPASASSRRKTFGPWLGSANSHAVSHWRR